MSQHDHTPLCLLRCFTTIGRVTRAITAFIVASFALSAQTVYPTGSPLLGASIYDAFSLTNASAARVSKTTASTALGFSNIWRIETTRDSSPAWAIEYKAPIKIAVAKGGVALVRFFARCTATSDETGKGRLRVVVQKSAANWDKSLSAEIYIGATWTEVFMPFTFASSFAEGGAELSFGVGFKRQTIEIGGIDCPYYADRVALSTLPRSRVDYPGREPDAAWRKAALERIDQLRQGDFVVRALTPDGQPILGAKVSVEMIRHHFQWGSCYQMSRIVNDSADNRIYRRKLLELFNAGSTENDLKWPPWSGEAGTGYSKIQTLAGLRWLKERGLHIRGHVLVWPSWKNLPSSVAALQGTPGQNDVPTRIKAHIADIVSSTKSWVDEWDVENEPYSNHDLMDLFGQSIQVDWFKAARAAHPTAPLFLNDYGNHDATQEPAHVAHFENTAKYLLAQGAPIGGLGLQAHFGGAPSSPVAILATLDRYAQLGLPIRITEFDINTEDEEMQADYTRDFLILCFSHPSVVGVQFWGFWSKAHWLPNAALYRDDWSEKPNARAFRQWVHEQWNTRATGYTTASGEWKSRGFHGDYIARLEVDGKTYEQTFQLRPNAPAPIVQLVSKSSRLGNLSTRAIGGTDDKALIAGFVAEGTGEIRLLLRAIGPSLTSFGILNAMRDPTLSVYRANQLLGINRGWASSPNMLEIAATGDAVWAFPLQTSRADSAMLHSFDEGVYTATVEGSGGVALVELYDANPKASVRLRNLSSRIVVGTGESSAVTGITVAGINALTLLFRAVGPSLQPLGIKEYLAHPSIVLSDARGPLAANQEWQSSPNAERIETLGRKAGAFSLQSGSADSALLATLAPGMYTVTISGADGGTGVCLAEIYDVDPVSGSQ